MRGAGDFLRLFCITPGLSLIAVNALDASGAFADGLPPISASGPSAPVYEYATFAQQAQAAGAPVGKV